MTEYRNVIVAETQNADGSGTTTYARVPVETPRVTAHDDGFIRTHDVAQSLIRSTALGARVVFERVDGAREQTRRYTITVERMGKTIAERGMYSLPVNAERLVTNTRETCARFTNEKA